MAGLHNLVAQGLAADAAAVAGIQGASATPVDALPATPFVVIGPPRGSMVGGSWERLFLIYPMHLFFIRAASADRDQVAINDFCDLFITGFRTGITLGVAGVVEALIASWDTNKEQDVNGDTYQLIEFVVSVEVDRPASYTP
jgi:hypothetical protein